MSFGLVALRPDGEHFGRKLTEQSWRKLRVGNSARVQVVTRVNVEQASLNTPTGKPT